MNVEIIRRLNKTLHLRLEERYLSRRKAMRSLERFMAAALENMKSENIQEREAKMLISIAQEQLKAVMAEADKPWKLVELALQRVEELQCPWRSFLRA